MKALSAIHHTKNALFLNTEKSNMGLFSCSVGSLFSYDSVRGIRYKRAAMTHKHISPASTRAVWAQPRYDISNCMTGPIAMVPTPLPAVTIPFDKPIRLKRKNREKQTY